MKRLVPLHSGTETATFQTSAREVTSSVMVVNVSTSNSSGTSPVLDAEVQYSADGTNWNSAASAQNVPQVAGDDGTFLRVETQGKFYRLNCVIGGTTPSFDVVAEAVHFE